MYLEDSEQWIDKAEKPIINNVVIPAQTGTIINEVKLGQSDYDTSGTADSAIRQFYAEDK